MSFNLFGPARKEDIRVGYISTERGFISDVTICEANSYAKLNPGTQFIFRTRDNIRYLNINEVNNLTPNDLIASDATCEGIQLATECGPAEVYFYGGGGVGVKGNPVIGQDGSLLAVDLVSGGFGYQYPPIVEVKDSCGIGAGSVTRAILGEVVETVEYYDQEDDFEEYEICEPTDVGYGLRFGPNGEIIGGWDPTLYANFSEDPIRREIEKYQNFLQKLEKPWWTTRRKVPLRLTSGNKVTRTKFDVTDSTFVDKQISNGSPNPLRWSDFMNRYAISPVPPSNVPGSDFAGIPYSFEWEEEFPYDGEYIFRGHCDNKAELYLDNIKLDDLYVFDQAPPKPIKKTITAGVHRIRLDILNLPITEKVVNDSVALKSNLKLKFIQRGNEYFIEATGDGSGEAQIIMDVNDTDYIAGVAAKEVVIPSDSGKLSFKRKTTKIGNTELNSGFPSQETIKKTGKFTAGKTYGPIQIIGAVAGAGKPNVSNNKLGLLDADGTDENIKIIIANVKSDKDVSSTTSKSSRTSQALKQKNIFNTIDYINRANRTLWRTFPSVGRDGDFIHQYGVTPFDPNTSEANTNSFAGTHRIVWKNINFPVDGNYIIELMVDDNVTLNFSGVGSDIVISKRGYSSPTQSTGKTTETKFFKAGNYTLRADLEQIKGKPLAQGNPMALAINITPSFVEEDVISAKSWNENPMGVALTIDAPNPPIPQEPIPVQEGRCPRNPIWSTRFPGANQRWYPVRIGERWSRFMNRYAISPVAPLADKGTDAGGTVYKNTWNIDIPYDGFYALRGTVDNFGRVLIDDKEISRLNGFKTENPDSKKIFLTRGLHKIQVEVENEKTETFAEVDKKIFSTSDWINLVKKPPQKINLNFRITTAASKKNTIEIVGLFSESKEKTVTAEVEVGKVYEVILKGSDQKLRIKSGVLEVEDSTDNDYNDIRCFPEKGRFFGINGTKCKFVVDDSSVEFNNIDVVKNGVKYNGPVLATYRSGNLGPFLTPAFRDDDDYRQNFMGTSWTLRWENVDFPEDGRYDLRAEADDELIVKVDGVEVGRAKVFEGVRNFTFNATKGKKTIEMIISNIPGNSRSTFETNPVVFNTVITKKVNVSTGISKTWVENPMGISAILIAPPCPKRVRGKGVVTDVEVDDPGNGYPIPQGNGYPVSLRLKNVVVENPGINYNCGVDQIQITPSNGAVLDYECDTFGRIRNIKVLNPGLGFTEYPEITIPSETGVNASFRPQFEVVRDPIVVDPEKLIQVTDLVGLKQTGYVNGRPYYGAVFYKEGVRYAGFYETIGDLVQVYDTLQESITAQVTTPPSAIQRQGTDVTSNDPRLNIPGTPQDLI